MEIKPILIEINESSFLHTTSGILIGEKYILTTSHIFGNVFPGKNEIFSKIPTGKFVSLTRKSDANFSIVEENSNKTKAILFGVFKCEGLLSEFKDWSPGDKNEMNSVNLKENISLFVFLTISNERVNQEHFKSILHTWLLNIYREKIQKLDRVLCVSTPFGSRDFLNSFSQGIVSTTLKNGSLYLSDCASAPGCEGGIVHINGKPVGIILSSFNWWRKDWVGFTLIGDLRPILSGLVFNNRLPMSSVADTFSKLEQIFQNSLVQINCGVNWGTGILLSKDKRVFMTNSHVVRNDFSIKILWKNKSAVAKLLWQSDLTQTTTAFNLMDFAIVQITTTCSWLSSLQSPELTADVPYHPGDSVYCAGYPLFSTTTRLPDSVTITHGIISKSNSKMINTNCAVYPGFSGGGLFTTQGELLGLIICNVKLNDTGFVYPKFNVALPFKAISSVIFRFLENDCDAGVFELWTLKGKL